MHLVDWFIVAAYLIWVVYDGLKRTKASSALEGYFLANRSLPWWAVGLTVMATQMSAITLVGTTGQGYADGMRFVQFYFGLPVAMIILSLTLVPFFYRAKVYTAYEYLERRFDVRTRTLASLLFLMSRGLQAGVIIAAPAVILSIGLFKGQAADKVHFEDSDFSKEGWSDFTEIPGTDGWEVKRRDLGGLVQGMVQEVAIESSGGIFLSAGRGSYASVFRSEGVIYAVRNRDGARSLVGQADATGEFMFAVQEARRIERGKLGELVRGVTISGIAFEVMSTVDAISDTFRWDLGSGYCGKGQPAKVDAGGPYVRCRATIGGVQTG